LNPRAWADGAPKVTLESTKDDDEIEVDDDGDGEVLMAGSVMEEGTSVAVAAAPSVVPIVVVVVVVGVVVVLVEMVVVWTNKLVGIGLNTTDFFKREGLNKFNFNFNFLLLLAILSSFV
jgi:hypothetical protein